MQNYQFTYVETVSGVKNAFILPDPTEGAVTVQVAREIYNLLVRLPSIGQVTGEKVVDIREQTRSAIPPA